MNLQEITDDELLAELTRRMSKMDWVAKNEIANKIGVAVAKGT